MIKELLLDQPTLMTEVYLETETVKLQFVLKMTIKNKLIISEERFSKNILGLLQTTVSISLMKKFGMA